jgi:O-antigen ligase
MRSKTEEILVWLWFFYCLLLVPDALLTVRELIVLISPILILWRFGFRWLKNYDWFSPTGIGLVVFFLFTGISQFITIDFLRGLDSFRAFHLKWLAINFSLLFLFQRDRNIKIILWGLVGSITIGTITAYYNYFAPYELQLFVPQVKYNYPTAPVSAFGHYKNVFATYYSIYLPIVISFSVYYYTRSSLRNYFFGSVLAAISVTSIPVVWFTQSRAVQGSLAVVLLLMGGYFLIKFGNVRMVLILLCFLVLVSGISLYFFPKGQRSLMRWEVNDIISSLEVRWQIWDLALQNIDNHFIFGLDLSRESLHEVTGIEKSNYQHEHNLYIMFLVRTGLIGLLGFITFSVLSLWIGISELISSKQLFVYSILPGILAGFLGGYLIRGVVAIFLRIMDFSVITALIFCPLGRKNT